MKLGRPVLVLAALQGGRATNDELKALFAARTGVRLKTGTLTQVTSRLRRAKLVDVFHDKRKGRNVYELTGRGKAHLAEMRRLLSVRAQAAGRKGQSIAVLRKRR